MKSEQNRYEENLLQLICTGSKDPVQYIKERVEEYKCRVLTACQHYYFSKCEFSREQFNEVVSIVTNHIQDCEATVTLNTTFTVFIDLSEIILSSSSQLVADFAKKISELSGKINNDTTIIADLPYDITLSAVQEILKYCKTVIPEEINDFDHAGLYANGTTLENDCYIPGIDDVSFQTQLLSVVGLISLIGATATAAWGFTKLYNYMTSHISPDKNERDEEGLVGAVDDWISNNAESVV